MKSLAEVKRFKTQIMFLSSSDVKSKSNSLLISTILSTEIKLNPAYRLVIKELLDSLQSSAKIPKADMELLTANYTD